MAWMTLLFSKFSFYSCLQSLNGVGEPGKRRISYWDCVFYLLIGKHSESHWCGY